MGSNEPSVSEVDDVTKIPLGPTLIRTGE